MLMISDIYNIQSVITGYVPVWWIIIKFKIHFRQKLLFAINIPKHWNLFIGGVYCIVYIYIIERKFINL